MHSRSKLPRRPVWPLLHEDIGILIVVAPVPPLLSRPALLWGQSRPKPLVHDHVRLPVPPPYAQSRLLVTPVLYESLPRLFRVIRLLAVLPPMIAVLLPFLLCPHRPWQMSTTEQFPNTVPQLLRHVLHP